MTHESGPQSQCSDNLARIRRINRLYAVPEWVLRYNISSGTLGSGCGAETSLL